MNIAFFLTPKKEVIFEKEKSTVKTVEQKNDLIEKKIIIPVGKKNTENIIKSNGWNTGKDHQRASAKIHQSEQNFLAQRKNNKKRPAELLLPGGSLYFALSEGPASINEPLSKRN